MDEAAETEKKRMKCMVGYCCLCYFIMCRVWYYGVSCVPCWYLKWRQMYG